MITPLNHLDAKKQSKFDCPLGNAQSHLMVHVLEHLHYELPAFSNSLLHIAFVVIGQKFF